MSALDDGKTVIQLITGSLPDNARLLRIADAFISYAGTRFNPADPLNPTNDEKAQLFMDEIRRFGRKVVRQVAMDASAAADVPDIKADGDAAAGDL